MPLAFKEWTFIMPCLYLALAGIISSGQKHKADDSYRMHVHIALAGIQKYLWLTHNSEQVYRNYICNQKTRSHLCGKNSYFSVSSGWIQGYLTFDFPCKTMELLPEKQSWRYLQRINVALMHHGFVVSHFISGLYDWKGLCLPKVENVPSRYFPEELETNVKATQNCPDVFACIRLMACYLPFVLLNCLL